MGQAPRELTPLESALDYFGAELRHWRTARKLSQVALGQHTHDSGALISKIEKGERFPSLALAQRLDRALKTGGALERLWPHLEHERATRQNRTDALVTGMESGAQDLGLSWPATPAATVEVLAELWRMDLNRRSVLAHTAWMAAACAGPVREWLLQRNDEVLHGQGTRPVSQQDIAALWAVRSAFVDADARLGGGYALSTLLHYLNQMVLPLLRGSYDDTIGRELMAATAALCDQCAFMSFDFGRQGLAQRYFIQALRLAQASGNRALGADILADMSKQAHYLGDARQARELADAGLTTALDCGSPLTAARCAVLQGRAYALSGDQRACAEACALAERALDRAVPADEPVWIQFFTPEVLTAEILDVTADLGQYQKVHRLAPGVLNSSAAMERSRTLCTITLASSYLPREGNVHSDIDRACDLLGQVIPSLSSLTSARTLERINSVRRELRPYAALSSVQEIEEQFQSHVTLVGTPR
ncbi:MAG: helix-turn-helix domain-containing protein [Pseudonocardiaceae bacterium]